MQNHVCAPADGLARRKGHFVPNAPSAKNILK
jgi:hypothetical protein